jgi:hypothetical protein
MITQARLKEILKYTPETGIFIWAKTRPKCPIGKIAGNTRKDGYVTIRLDGSRYFAHRLAWLYIFGEFPPMEIDHIDRNPSNNSISNLRLAEPSQNQANRGAQKNNSSGFVGVRKSSSSGKWFAGTVWHGKYYHAGSFASKEQAAVAYIKKCEELKGAFAPQAMAA